MDKRIERTHFAVRKAAIDVLGDRGYAAFTMEAVAEAAGVAKSTLYRHWPTKLSLVADALETLNRQPPPRAQRDHGDVRQRVHDLIHHLAEVFAGSRFAACMPALIEAAERHPEVADFLHGYSARRRQALVDALREGISEGTLPSDLDVEVASLALSGAIFYRRIMTPEPFRIEEVPALVDLILGPGSPA